MKKAEAIRAVDEALAQGSILHGRASSATRTCHITIGRHHYATGGHKWSMYVDSNICVYDNTTDAATAFVTRVGTKAAERALNRMAR